MDTGTRSGKGTGTQARGSQNPKALVHHNPDIWQIPEQRLSNLKEELLGLCGGGMVSGQDSPHLHTCKQRHQTAQHLLSILVFCVRFYLKKG